MQTLRILALAMTALLAAHPAQAHYERAELEQMLAPIALYPDSVLSHVLIAATYPDQLAEAAEWSRDHPRLEGEAAVDAVERKDWDPSVKALVAFPEVLARMDEDPEWTDELGDAFLDHESDVMDSVQSLRQHAYDAGRLGSLDNVKVVREHQYIYIEPAHHHVIFVPYYDPWWAYGGWWWPHHPPYYWRTWYGRPYSYYGGGWYWGTSYRVQPTFYSSTFYWPQRRVVVNYRERNLYSGRHVSRSEDVRYWREEPAARRHASRPVDPRSSPSRSSAVEKREYRSREAQRREEGRDRDTPQKPARRDRPSKRSAERAPRDEDASPRRERMQRGRELRDSQPAEAPATRRESGSEYNSRRNEAPARREIQRGDEPRAERAAPQSQREDAERKKAPRQGEEESEPRRSPRNESRGESRSESRRNNGGGNGEGNGRGRT
ncbi:MAG TPA: DUF3300 domain-containing protein [Verrucomicrobiae bacterium]|nr:DUF3300 domain-containing protein [Verrucomicrobiae bacterium]